MGKKFLGLNDVLVLSPHPDDAEYTVAGITKLYLNTRFHIFVMSTGGDLDETNKFNRISEVYDFWDKFNSKNVIVDTVLNHSKLFGDACYVKSIDHDVWVNFLENEYINHIDCIMTSAEMDAHFEHEFVAKLAYPMVQTSLSILQYRSPSTRPEWIPNLIVDIEDVYEEKIKVLKETFNSQKDRLYFTRESLDAFHTEFQSTRRGISWVEQFKIIDLKL